jgi:hypothetical protein
MNQSILLCSKATIKISSFEKNPEKEVPDIANEEIKKVINVIVITFSIHPFYACLVLRVKHE